MYTQPVQLATVQIYSFESNTLLLPADLMCSVLAGRPLHSMLTALSINISENLAFYHRQTETKTIFESLGLHQVCLLAPLQATVLQLKTGLRTTSIFSNMSFAAGSCQTCTRDTSPLQFLVFTYTSATSIIGWRGPGRSNET